MIPFFPPLLILPEPFKAIWSEFSALVELNMEEAEGADPRRPSNPGKAELEEMAERGILHVISARQSGRLLGWYFWVITPDIASIEVLQAIQMTYFVLPEARGKGIGKKLLDGSLSYLKALGIDYLLLHAPPFGAGKDLGSAFKAIGAKPHQQVYSLWLKEE